MRGNCETGPMILHYPLSFYPYPSPALRNPYSEKMQLSSRFCYDVPSTSSSSLYFLAVKALCYRTGASEARVPVPPLDRLSGSASAAGCRCNLVFVPGSDYGLIGMQRGKGRTGRYWMWIWLSGLNFCCCCCWVKEKEGNTDSFILLSTSHYFY